ncbi:MAG: histone family protein [Nitrososphaerales archaeon]
MSEAEFGLAAVYRILKKSGAERVSNEAVEELRRSIEEIAVDVAKQAVELASHAGRHTIMGSDVKLATKNVFR